MCRLKMRQVTLLVSPGVCCCWLSLILAARGENLATWCPPTCTCDDSAYTCVAVNASDLEDAVQGLKDRPVGLLHLVCPSLNRLPDGLLSDVDVEGLVISANLAHLDNETFSGTPGLTALSLAANALTSLPPRILPPFLHRLDLSDNRLTAVNDDAFAALRDLQFLRLDGNPLQLGTKALNGLFLLEHLGLSRCQLFSPPSFKLPNLRILDLSSNLLEILPDDLFSSTPLLEQLHLSRNRLRLLPTHGFSSLPNLRSLYLDGNHLMSLPAGVGVGNLSSLEILDLSGNWLRSVPAEGVGQTPQLRQLLLRDNAISWVHQDAFMELKRLKVLELEDNMLHCDCTLQGFAAWLLSHPPMRGSKSAVCQEPSDLQGTSIVDLSLDQMHCFTTTAGPYFQRLEETDAEVTWWKETESSQFHVAWQFSSPPLPYECDSIFVAQGEELRVRVPVKCDSNKLKDPSRVLLDVDADLIASGSRLCLVLLSHSHPLAACAFLSPQANCPLKINVSRRSDGSVNVDWDVTLPTSLCEVTGSFHVQGEIVANTSVACSTGSLILHGVRDSETNAFACLSLHAPYSCPDVCAPITIPPTSSRPYIILGLALCTVAMVFLIAFALRRWCLRKRAVKKSLEPWPSLLHTKEVTSAV